MQDQTHTDSNLKWYKRPIGFLIVAVLVIFGGGAVLYFFGWR